MDEALIAAMNAARVGAAELLAGYEESLLLRYNGPSPAETDYERKAELSIRKIISDAFPEHPIYTKGSEPPSEEQKGPWWYVDSLDGAFNYLRNSPFFSLSIGFFGHDAKGILRPMIGVILAPVLMEMFWATYGGGAFHCQQVPGIGLTEGPIYVSDAGITHRAVVKTGFRPDLEAERLKFKNQVRQMQDEVAAIGLECSASLTMAYVAAGRVEGYFESGLNPWSAAAGTLVVSEAGGKVSSQNGRPFQLEERGDILVSNRLLHDKFVEILTGV